MDIVIRGNTHFGGLYPDLWFDDGTLSNRKNSTGIISITYSPNN